MAKEKDLHDAFYETLKDVYYAEKQSVKACKTSAKSAKAPKLKELFPAARRDERASAVERLQQVFEMIGKSARAKTCEAMQGIVSEMEEDLEDFGDTAAGDAVLIGCAQAVEHYEIDPLRHAEDLGDAARPHGRGHPAAGRDACRERRRPTRR